MTEKRKKNLTLLGVTLGLVALLGGAVAGIAQNAFAEEEILQAKYAYGHELYIPDYAVDGEEATDYSLLYPSGVLKDGREHTLDEAGKYTVKYEVNGVVETETFVVEKSIVNFAVEGSDWYYGTHEYAPNTPGFVVKVANGDQLKFNQIVDVSKMTKADSLFKFFVTPNSIGQEDVSTIVVRMTDIYDPTNYVDIQIRNVSTTYGAWADRQTYYVVQVGEQPTISGTSVNDLFGWPTYQATTGVDPYGLSIGSNVPWSCTFDYANRDIWCSAYCLYDGTNGSANWNNIPLGDLDNPDYLDVPWQGFTTGEVYISFYGISYQAPSMNLLITEVAGIDLTKASFLDEEAPVIEVDLGENESAPDGLLNKAYKLFDATAIDAYDGVRAVETNVYYNYNTRGQVSVYAKDGYFYPTTAGTYTIEYSATDTFGNKGVKTVEVDVKNQADGLDFVIHGQAEFAWAGEAVQVAQSVSVSNERGKYSIKGTATLNGENVLFLSALASLVLAGGIGASQVTANAAEVAPTTFEMLEGASIRATDPTGIRFKVKLGSNYYEELTSNNGSELHVALIPYSYYGAYQADGTKGDLALYPWLVNKYGAENVLEVEIPTEKIYQTTDEETDETYYCANAVISNVYFNNYHLDFVGVAYMENGTTYTDATVTEANARSIYDVATMAMADAETYAEYKEFLDETVEKAMYYAYGVRYNKAEECYTLDGLSYDTYEEAKTAANVDVTDMKVSVGDLVTKVGATYALNAKVTFADGKAYTQDANLAWSVADSEVATVENGVVTAKKAGETTVTVSAFGGKYTATCKVTVAEAVVEKTYTVKSVDGIICSDSNVKVSIPEGAGEQVFMNGSFNNTTYTIYVPLPETYVSLKSVRFELWSDGATKVCVGDTFNPSIDFVGGAITYGSFIAYTATAEKIATSGYESNKNQVALTVNVVSGGQVIFNSIKFTYEASHVHGEYTYVDNGNGTYNETCGCGTVTRVLEQKTYTFKDWTGVTCSDATVTLSSPAEGQLQLNKSPLGTFTLTFTLPETYVALTKISMDGLWALSAFVWVGETMSDATCFVKNANTGYGWHPGANYPVTTAMIEAAGYNKSGNQVVLTIGDSYGHQFLFNNLTFTYLVEHQHTSEMEFVDNGDGTYSEKYACCGAVVANYRAEEKSYVVKSWAGVTCSDASVTLSSPAEGQLQMNSDPFSGSNHIKLTFTLPDTYSVLTGISVSDIWTNGTVTVWVGSAWNPSALILNGSNGWNNWIVGPHKVSQEQIAAAGYGSNRNQVDIGFVSDGGSQILFNNLVFTYVVLTKI